MSYSVNVTRQNQVHDYLAVLSLRRFLESSEWSVNSDGFSFVTFDWGDVSAVESIDSAFHIKHTQVASYKDLSLDSFSAQFFYEPESHILYVTTGLSEERSFIVSYDLYIATSPVNWHKLPTDTTSRQVHFEGVISSAPSVSSSQADALFGFIPLQVGSITCLEASEFWMRHLYDSSFNRGKFRLYHVVGKLKAENISYMITAYTKSVSVTDQKVTIELVEPQEILDKEFRFYDNPAIELGGSFYKPGSLDKVFEYRPVRRIYGKVDGFPFVNFTFKNSIDSGDNRMWVFGHTTDNYSTVWTQTYSALLNTATRTYLLSVNGFDVDDWITFGPDGGNTWARITAVGSNYVDHTSITAQGAGVKAQRLWIGYLTVVQNEGKFYPMPGRDFNYVLANGDPNPIGVEFKAGFESNHAGMVTIESSHTVVGRIYGVTDLPTIGGVEFGTLDPKTQSITNGVVIIYSLLKQAGVEEAEIDTDTFVELASVATAPVGFALPQTAMSSMWTYREAIARILPSLMLRLFVDHTGKWTLRQLAPLSDVAHASFDDFDFDLGGVDFKISYDDLASKINVKYNYVELDTTVANMQTESWSTASVTNARLRVLHQVVKEQEFQTVLLKTSDAQTLARRLSYVYSERRGLLTVQGRSKMLSTVINDTVEINRTRMPGEIFDGQTEFSRFFGVIETTKSLNSVTLVLDDQKGIEDNAGEW